MTDNEAVQYKQAFCDKFSPWMMKKWQENPVFCRWIDSTRFLSEETHGLGHSATVRTKAQTIIENYLASEEQKSLDYDFLDKMALFHDIARHVVYPAGDSRGSKVINRKGVSKKEYRAQRCIFPHELTGAAMAKIVLAGEMSDFYLRDLLNHDYHSPEVTPYCKPPRLLETQIFCLADKTSINPAGEAERRIRYLTKRENNPVPFLDLSFPIEQRREWNFGKDAVDALCAVIPIFSFRTETFTSSNGLKNYYRDWSSNLEGARTRVVEMARETGGADLQEATSNIFESFDH